MFPVDTGVDPETLRRHTVKVAEGLSMQATAKTPVNTEAIAVTLDSTFIRGCEDGERHQTQMAGGLPSDNPERAAAKMVIVEQADQAHAHACVEVG
jgi:hypothetical protein